jgi:hypothetical protein
MQNLLTRTLLSIAVAMPVMTTAPMIASAQDLELRLDRNGPSVRVDDDDDWRRDGYASDWRNDGIPNSRPGCSPGRALDKAERMGLRRVRLADVDRRTIEVQGRKRNGERVYVTFSRQSRSCAVL